jgi:hypothetical protein
MSKEASESMSNGKQHQRKNKDYEFGTWMSVENEKLEKRIARQERLEASFKGGRGSTSGCHAEEEEEEENQFWYAFFK